MLYGGADIPYRLRPINQKVMLGNPTRLYTMDELKEILRQRGMEIVKTFSDYYGAEESDKSFQLLVYARKQ